MCVFHAFITRACFVGLVYNVSCTEIRFEFFQIKKKLWVPPARGGSLKGCLEAQSLYPVAGWICPQLSLGQRKYKLMFACCGNEKNPPNFYGSLNTLIDKIGPVWTIIKENVQI